MPEQTKQERVEMDNVRCWEEANREVLKFLQGLSAASEIFSLCAIGNTFWGWGWR